MILCFGESLVDLICERRTASLAEADADGDGFGDETQDACPSDATTQAACPAPETQITKRPKKRLRKGKKTKVEFVSNPPGATFECSLDGLAFTACSSPKKLGPRRKGVHVFRVRAVNGAQADETPAQAKFRVVKKKKRRR